MSYNALNFWTKLFAGFVLVFTLLVAGCPSGCAFDPAAIPLDGQVKDYGNAVKENRAPIEAVTYGQLMPGTGEAGSSGGIIAVRYNDIFRVLGQINDLPKTHPFDDTQKAALETWVNRVKEDIARDIAPIVAKASESAANAKNLAAQLEPYVKSAGSLTATVANGRRTMAPSAVTDYDTLSNELVLRFEKLYQGAVAAALGMIQGSASREIEKISSAVNRLDRAVRETAIINTPANLGMAKNALSQSRAKMSETRVFIDKMNRSDKVESLFTAAKNQLRLALNQIRTDYIGNVVPASLAQAQAVFAEAEAAMNELDVIATNFFTIEVLKTPAAADAKLVDLVDKALSRDANVLSGLAQVDKETDINQLTRLLSEHSLVVMPKDNSSVRLIEAFASAVVHKVVLQYGLTNVDNVVGPAQDAITKMKSDLGMTPDQFAEFLLSRAQKIREQMSKQGTYKNVYVVFADDFAGADVSSMVNEFLKDQGKVIVVTNDQAKFKNGKLFAHKYLHLNEGVILANAIIHEQDPKMSPQLISETLVKIDAAFGHLTIGDLRQKVIGALARVPKEVFPGEEDIRIAVKDALALYQVPVGSVEESGVLGDDLSEVQRRLSYDRLYYVQRARGISDVALQTIEELRRARADNNLLRTALNTDSARRTRLTALNLAYEGYKTALDAVVNGVNIYDAVRDYRDEVDDFRRDALGTLSSMEALLDNNLCVFAPAANYDGGYAQFKENVSKQLYNDVLLKNPMSLFTIASNSVVAPAAPTAEQRAAIGLNCFLTGPGRSNDNDGRFKLKEKTVHIKNEINRVANDARSLAEQMRTNTLPVVEARYNALKERRQSTTTIAGAAAFNANYWKKELSPHTIAAGFVPELGKLFDVKTYVKSYPTVHSPDILPGLAGVSSLPSSLFANHNTFGRVSLTLHNNEYDLSAPGLMNVWTISRAYGRSLQLGPPGVPTLIIDAAQVGSALPGFIPAHNDFLKLNYRIWAWFLSRVAGKLTDQIPLNGGVDELYAVQGGVDYFDNNHVFIEQLLGRTPGFLEQVDRYIIARKSLAVINEYKAMGDLLYSLPSDDFNAFLSQPANELTRFFAQIEQLMTNRTNVNSILVDTRANITANWIPNFYHADIMNVLPTAAGPTKFNPAVAAPMGGGENGRLTPIWPSLTAAAARVETLLNEIMARVALVP